MSSSVYVMDQQKVRYEWNTTPWRKLEKFVFKLQKRIYRASKCNDIKKMHNLQRLLLKSTNAKMLAVRRVTQDNRGKRTAGVDGKSKLNQKERLQLAGSLNIKEKAKPSRRIWIPKPGKTEKRPLGIPTIADRAKQTLVKMVLEPEWEAKFTPNSYGFRPGRSCHDAIEAIFNGLKHKVAFILDADISGCFDNIDHNALLKKLNTTPTLTKIIKGWLRAGVMGAPRKAFRIQLVKIQPRQSLANSLEQTVMLRKVTSVVKLMEWTIQGATKVKVLSPEIPEVIEVDIFHMMEDSMKGNDKASYHSLYRDLRPRHVLKWILNELGRSFVFLTRYVGTSQQRRELTEDAEEVGLIDSTQSVGKPHTRGSDQQCRNWFRDCYTNTTEVGI